MTEITKETIEAANVPVRERIERLVRDVKDGAIIGYDGPQEYWSTRMGAEASMEIARLLERKLVKVLCWEDAKDKGYSQANCALGQYQVSWLGEFENWQCCRPHRAGLDWKDNFSRHPSKDEAKAAAQADYETRILSALSSSPGKDGGQAWDDPTLDGTEGAHPAWWRGCDHGYAKGLASVGKDGGQEVEELRREIASLQYRLDEANGHLRRLEAGL